MATTSKYFVLTPTGDNLDFLDFGLNYGSITTVGESIQYNGSSKLDSVFIRPGLTYDLTNTASGEDKIYLTGNLADYSKSVAGTVLTLSRTVGGLTEEVKLSTGTSLNFDNLIFANGTVNANTLAVAVAGSLPLPTPNPSEVSGAPAGAAAPGATLNATVRAYSNNPAAVDHVGETFASTRPGINLVVSGGAGIDTVYVADGETVDARVLGASVDLVYMRGTWADYTKTLLSSETQILFTRVIGGVTESVTVTAGTPLNFDKLIFADGAVDSVAAKNAILFNPALPITSVVGNDPNTKTPLYNDAEVAAALAKIQYAAQHDTALSTPIAAPVYTIAGVTGVTPSNLGAINSALDSPLVDGSKADTAAHVQSIVNGYTAILASADGTPGNTATPITVAQYTDIGVTGVTPGSGLSLLDNVIDGKAITAVNTEPLVQALANAAAHVMTGAAGGTAPTLNELTLLGITGVTADILSGVGSAIAATADNGSDLDTLAKLQSLVNGVNHAPSVNVTPVAGIPGGLFGTASGGTVLELPEVTNTGQRYGSWQTPAGWSAKVVQGANEIFNNYQNAAAPNAPAGSLSLPGVSANGGDFIELLQGIPQKFDSTVPVNSLTIAETVLTGLTIGKTYTIAVQWAPIADSSYSYNGYNYPFSGGSLAIGAAGGQPFQQQIYSAQGSGWQTAAFSFVARANYAAIDIANAQTQADSAVAFDSLTLQQTNDAVTTQGSGVGTSSLFGGVSDIDPGAALKGWAITRAATDSAGHHWQYSTNAGSTWSNMDGASLSQAVYLSGTDLVRWTGVKGTNTELDAKAVDNTGPALHAANAAATLVDASVSGGSTPYSGNTAVLAANAAPLVLDLNHSGQIDYSHITMAMDGQLVSTAWVGANDGMLLWDKYGDATVHGSEQYVFGQSTGSDLTGLRFAFDSNKDLQLNAQDAKFSQFGVWQDSNQNGVVDSGEYHTLSQLGITSLSLDGDKVSVTAANGVSVNGQTTAALSDGGTMLVEDAIFSYTNLTQLLMEQAVHRSAVM